MPARSEGSDCQKQAESGCSPGSRSVEIQNTLDSTPFRLMPCKINVVRWNLWGRASHRWNQFVQGPVLADAVGAGAVLSILPIPALRMGDGLLVSREMSQGWGGTRSAACWPASLRLGSFLQAPGCMWGHFWGQADDSPCTRLRFRRVISEICPRA